jgi:hypothetical protein
MHALAPDASPAAGATAQPPTPMGGIGVELCRFHRRFGHRLSPFGGKERLISGCREKRQSNLKEHLMRQTQWPNGFPESVLQRRPDLAQKVGLIIDRWGYIERMLRNILASLLNIQHNEAFSVLHAISNFRTRLDILRSAAAYMPDTKDKRDLFKLLDKVGKEYLDRNTIIHGWYLSGKDVEIFLAKPTRKTDVREQESIIDRHLAQLDKLFADLKTFALSDTGYPKRRHVKWRQLSS